MAKMILRFRTKDGMFRITADGTDPFEKVVSELMTKIDADTSSLTFSLTPNGKGEKLPNKTVTELGFKNGEMIFANYEKPDEELNAVEDGTASISLSGDEISVPIDQKRMEIAVDTILDQQDGLIARKKSYMCRHGDKGMCEYCSPLPPWDKEYRESNGIKHLSFYSYLKEINDTKNNKNNATSYMPPLEVPSYKINKQCPSGHQPYPRGICSKCQPPVITLQQQQFRMVDHVEFSDPGILNKFIDSWRLSGTQRFGYLYGSYEPFEKVPLGIKAKVEFIYEPPQSNELDGLTLLPWANEAEVDSLAAKFNFYKVGMIFTDLTDSGLKNGTVLCKRHKDSYFLSNIEVMMAAKQQRKHPYFSKYCSSSQFSSRFITCVVSGGLNGEIEPRSFQVSLNTESLVDADIITTSTQPSMMYINETTDQRYVPEVFYSKINEYGLQVKTNAKPAFPIDYLLVTLSDSMPKQPNPFFASQNSFIIENREFLGELQNFQNLISQLGNDLGDGTILLDFHLLSYLTSLNILHETELQLLTQFVVSRSNEDYLLLVESPGWMSLITILQQST